jgi:CDP-diacylglycerol---glycerol-3-phosphate 3-phosphatidyltransferase
MRWPASARSTSPGRAAWANAANLVTGLRVLLIPVIGWLLVVGGDVARWWAFGIFLFAAFTDTIDGWLARRLSGTTRWGQMADPAADKALIISSLAILAVLGELPWWAVLVIAGREAAVTLQRVILLRREISMPASVFGKAKTLAQVAAVTMFLLPATPSSVDLAVLWMAVALTVLSGVEYAFRGRRLARAR